MRSIAITPSLDRRERKLAWLVGSPRSGSTWLFRLLCDSPGIVGVPEPLIGMHLGVFASALGSRSSAHTLDRPRIVDNRRDDQYFFAAARADDWAPGLRRLVLERFRHDIPRSARFCVVHEPNGSEGTDVLTRALPNSRLLFLVRDGRDVVDSMVDAARPGTWLDEAFGLGEERTGDARLSFVEEQAARWRIRTEVVERAYDQHQPHLRHRVRYEDLLADTAGELSKIYQWLGIDSSEDLDARVERHTFDAVPSENRGPGKFYRAAKPGLWRHHLTESEQEACHAVMSQTLLRLGYVV